MQGNLRRALAAAAASLAAAAATPAWAQMDFTATVIGATVGNMASRKQVACIPDTSALIPAWGPKLDRVVSEYIGASARGDARTMRKLFSKAADGGEWVSDGVIRARNDLGGNGAPDAGAPIVTRVSLVFGGDTWTARGVWKIEPVQGSAEIFHVVDLRRTKGWGIWQIWRIRTYEAPPALPASFCTFDEKVTALW
jgi:hypothetical protein